MEKGHNLPGTRVRLPCTYVVVTQQMIENHAEYTGYTLQKRRIPTDEYSTIDKRLRHRRFPREGRRSGNAAEEFPFLKPWLRRNGRSPARPLGLGRFWKEAQPEAGEAEPLPKKARYPATRARHPGAPAPASSASASADSRVAFRGGEAWMRGAARAEEQRTAGSGAPSVLRMGAETARADRKSGRREPRGRSRSRGFEGKGRWGWGWGWEEEKGGAAYYVSREPPRRGGAVARRRPEAEAEAELDWGEENFDSPGKS
eukprot:XP_022264104.1 uncharacterized protein LOC111091848 [Canis lupus familiaris]